MTVDFKKLMDEVPSDTVFDVPIFGNYIIPNGFLSHAVEEHALFYYYINARRAYEELILEAPVVYEGDSDPDYNFRELFTSISALYNCQPESMAQAWSVVDKQCEFMELPKMPNEPKYRFAEATRIITQ